MVFAKLTLVTAKVSLKNEASDSGLIELTSLLFLIGLNSVVFSTSKDLEK